MVAKPPLKAGDILHLTRAASVQFINPFYFRFIRKHDWSTYEGWMWIDGYQLGDNGEAVDRRSLFVQVAGLRIVNAQPQQRIPVESTGTVKRRKPEPRLARAEPRRRKSLPVKG